MHNKKLLITEQQILELQDLFLANGIHHLSVSSFEEGRILLYRFLDALRCYSNIACATQDGSALRKTILDLQKYMDSLEFFEEKNTHEFQKFFTEEFDFDFVWLEQSSAYSHGMVLEHALVSFSLDQRLPIFIVSIKE